jgi:hypothetical protein
VKLGKARKIVCIRDKVGTVFKTNLDDNVAEVDAERLKHVLGVGIDVNLINANTQLCN